MEQSENSKLDSLHFSFRIMPFILGALAFILKIVLHRFSDLCKYFQQLFDISHGRILATCPCKMIKCCVFPRTEKLFGNARYKINTSYVSQEGKKTLLQKYMMESPIQVVRETDCCGSGLGLYCDPVRK